MAAGNFERENPTWFCRARFPFWYTC